MGRDHFGKKSPWRRNVHRVQEAAGCLLLPGRPESPWSTELSSFYA